MFNLETISGQIIEALTPIIVMLIVALLSAAFKFLLEKGKGVKWAYGAEALGRALTTAETVLKDAILATKQVYVDAIKARNTDGKLSKEEAGEALKLAVDYFLAHLPSDILKILTAAFGDLESWAAGKIESMIGASKNPDFFTLKQSK